MYSAIARISDLSWGLPVNQQGRLRTTTIDCPPCQTSGIFRRTMNSVIVFFGGASFEEVERAASKHGFSDGTVRRSAEHFYLWRYSEKKWNAEYEVEELGSLRQALGAEIESAFQIASHHGENARFAIQVLCALMSNFQPSVLDDDHGNLWLPEQVAACAASNPPEGLYVLQSAASQVGRAK
ncbi:hypothetical protein FQZ97_741820 [compost metagenome]